MNFFKLSFFAIFVLFNSIAGASGYKFEGFFKDHDGENRWLIFGLFLPYNPQILTFGNDSNIPAKCKKKWPEGTCRQGNVQNKNPKSDFLWIESDGGEFQILKHVAQNLKETRVIYTTTHFSIPFGSYNTLRQFLESSGFVLLSHWYWEGNNGNAIFLRKDIYEASMRSLNYSPGNPHCFLTPAHSSVLKQFFHPVENKSPKYTIDEIDQIYMINLDERPEKFAQASAALQVYGISPYRFSAVNGWKLPASVLNQIGVKYTSGMTTEKFMGSIYKEIDGQMYQSNELIEKEGVNYFSLGMSRGAIGCVMSHLSILQDAYDEGYNTIWIIEDDIEIIEDPWQIPDLIRKLDDLEPDWDILFTDTDTKDPTGHHVACRAIAARPNFNIQPMSSFLEKFYPLSNEFSRIGMRYGTYSMIVRRSGMKKILDYFNTYHIFLPYDMDYWLIPDLKLCCCNKDIVSHKAGAPSDNGSANYTK